MIFGGLEGPLIEMLRLGMMLRMVEMRGVLEMKMVILCRRKTTIRLENRMVMLEVRIKKLVLSLIFVCDLLRG